jgi:hypothetical protein
MQIIPWDATEKLLLTSARQTLVCAMYLDFCGGAVRVLDRHGPADE